MGAYAVGRRSSILEAMRTIATVVLVSGLALGQGPGGGMGGPMSPADREPMMFDMVCDQLDLKKGQKKQCKGILDKGKETVLPMHQDLNEARALIRNAVKTGADAAQLSQAFGGAQAELVAAEAKIYGEVLAMLTAPARAGR